MEHHLAEILLSLEGCMIMQRDEKATFKAIREECGLSQSDVAGEADVSVTAVKRWENPKYDQTPPDDVRAFVRECHERMERDAREIAREIAADLRETDGAKAAVIPYYRTQEQLDAVQLDGGVDEPVGVVNARMRAVARILDGEGVPSSFAYPETRKEGRGI